MMNKSPWEASPSSRGGTGTAAAVPATPTASTTTSTNHNSRGLVHAAGSPAADPSNQHTTPPRTTPTTPAFFDAAVPITTAVVNPQSKREISELTTTAFAGNTRRKKRDAGNRRSRRGRGRPGHGIFLFWILILTIVGVVLWSVKETRRMGVIVFLPIYSACLLGYILFLCFVKNGQGDDDEGPSKPLALREYLSKQQRRERRKRRKREDKYGQPRRTSSQVKDVKLLNETGRTEDSFHEHIDSSFSESYSFDSESLDVFYDARQEQDDGTDGDEVEEVNLADVFQAALPKLSQTFEAFEEQVHSLAARVRHAIVPPHECYQCRDGVYSTRREAMSTVCAGHHGHHHHGRHHGHYGHGHCAAAFQQPHVDVENYMSQPHVDAYDDSFRSSSFETDLSFESVTNDNHNDNNDDSMRDVSLSTSPSSRTNLTGKYKLVHNHNFDAFLKSQNVPMLIRKAANSSRPIHTITHEGETLRIQVDGITKGDTTYIIDGPPSESHIRHLKFDDYVTWVDDGQAVQVRKVAKNAPPNGAVELIVKRQLANHGHNLILSSKAKFEDGSESLESVQTFHRIHLQ